MSGIYPTNPNFSAFNFQDNRPSLINQTLSGKRQVRQIGGQYFSFSVQMPLLNQSDYQTFYSFLQKQKGMTDEFQIQYPINNLGASNLETDILVNGAKSVTDDSIVMDGFSTTTNALRAGDLIKFNGHSKVYMVADNVNASGGSATVNISPPLVANVANNELVKVNRPLFTVYITGDTMYSTSATGFYTIGFEVREIVI